MRATAGSTWAATPDRSAGTADAGAGATMVAAEAAVATTAATKRHLVWDLRMGHLPPCVAGVLPTIVTLTPWAVDATGPGTSVFEGYSAARAPEQPRVRLAARTSVAQLAIG